MRAPTIVRSRARVLKVGAAAGVIAFGGLLGAPGTRSGPAAAAAGLLPAPQLFVAAEFTYGPVTPDHLLLAIDQPIDPLSIPDPSAFTWHILASGPVSQNPPPPPPDVPATGLTFLYEGFNYLPDIFPTGMSLLRLDLGTTVDPSASIAVTYRDPGSSARPIRSLAGLEMASFGPTAGALLNDPALAGIMAPFVDDGLGPDHVMLIALQPFDPHLPPASDFKVWINGSAIVPTSITTRIPGNGLAVLDLQLPSPISIAAGDSVMLSYDPINNPPPAAVLAFLGGGSVAPINPPIDAFVSLPTTPSRATPTGSFVLVAPYDSSTGSVPATIDFTTVTGAGTTSVASGSVGPAVPIGYALADPHFYDLSTTATFSSAQVCFDYIPPPAPQTDTSLRLLHYVAGAWVPVTDAGFPDTVNHRICGTVTSFSPFAIVSSVLSFSGIFSPVDNEPTVNVVKAGSAIPVKFGLGGNLGLSIFRAGSPSSQALTCQSGAPVDAIEQTVSPGSATLSFDAGTNRYTYVWKTAKSWLGCRRLTLTFYDGTTRSAMFSFK